MKKLLHKLRNSTMSKEPTERSLPEDAVREHYIIHGRVQGVGFRYRAKYACDALRITGFVRNLDNGTVEMEAQGTRTQLEKMFEVIETSPFIVIDYIDRKEIAVDFREGSFRVQG